MCELGLSSFEALALERLRLLRAVEKVSSLGAAKYSKEWADKMDEEIRKAPELARYAVRALNASLSTGEDRSSTHDALLARERDHFSHYILRLAFCREEEQRRWFAQQEYDLFR